MMRILITGSRTWTNVAVIRTAFRPITREHHAADITLVSGACPTGADSICELLAHDLGWTVERHPADWSLGKKAGFIRNAEMVALGADRAFAFIHQESRGATMTARLAREAGIPITIYRES